jgi:hypothetical protein
VAQPNLRIDVRGIDALQKALEQASKKSVPYAARETLNTLAFEGRKIWQGEMRQALTLRNQFTERRALVERATGSKLKSMESALGHTETYVEQLEHGKSVKANKQYRPIPTEHAAGQAKGSLAGGRKRAVRKGNIITKLGSLRAKVGNAKGRKARNARAVEQAIKSGKRLALLHLDKRQGIYRVMGSKRKPTIRKLYDLTKRVTPKPKIPTLQRTLDKVLPLGPAIALDALEKQFARLN